MTLIFLFSNACCQAGVVDGCSKNVGNLLYMVADLLHDICLWANFHAYLFKQVLGFMWQVATKYPANALVHRPVLVQEYIVTSKV